MAWRCGTSFGESDRLDRRPVGETREVVAQAAVARELDGVGDEDGVGGGAAGGGAAFRENKGSGREVERPLEVGMQPPATAFLCVEPTARSCKDSIASTGPRE